MRSHRRPICGNKPNETEKRGLIGSLASTSFALNLEAITGKPYTPQKHSVSSKQRGCGLKLRKMIRSGTRDTRFSRLAQSFAVIWKDERMSGAVGMIENQPAPILNDVKSTLKIAIRAALDACPRPQSAPAYFVQRNNGWEILGS